jgi:hypothetical protein
MRDPTVEAATARETASLLIRERRLPEAEALLRSAAQRARYPGHADPQAVRMSP